MPHQVRLHQHTNSGQKTYSLHGDPEALRRIAAELGAQGRPDLINIIDAALAPAAVTELKGNPLASADFAGVMPPVATILEHAAEQAGVPLTRTSGELGLEPEQEAGRDQPVNRTPPQGDGKPNS